MNRDSRDVLILSAAAFVLLVVTTGEVLFRATSDAPMPDTVFFGIVTNVPIHVGILYGAVRLRRSALPPQYSRRVIRWSLIGAVVAGLLIGMFAPFIFDTWFNWVATVRWGVSIGIGSGFLAGYLTARVTEQRVLAERASVRAEEARERQEVLEYLNALLRHEILNGTSAIQG